MKKILLLAFAALAFAACSDDTYNYYETPFVATIDFEGAQLGEAGFIWGKSQATEQDDVDYMGKPIRSNIYYGPIYAEQSARFYTYYSDNGQTYESWGSFIISNQTDMETSGYKNDKSVYAPTGANGSEQFAIGYYSEFTPEGKGIPTIQFTSAVAPLSVDIANTTYTYLYFKDGDTVDFSIEITGYNCGIETGKVSVVLATASPAKIAEGWETVDLSTLGNVTELVFTAVCADEYAPAYFALDDLSYVE